MNNYALTFARSARKELEGLDASIVRRIFPAIEALASNPRPHGCRKLRGEENLWRIRVGPYRVVFTVDDHQRLVDIIAVRHRKEAYR
ncbi:MAG: type II toxin-antitoxin system RelE/ParE family toxin [Acidobacteriia bacterium]|nr:type II toxin-antitoxin system RelE/ParE family toxin [Terriglobia bacterium]